ncbi:MAG: tetratricopeptide repeat protein [Isosphaeraceae bacterium]
MRVFSTLSSSRLAARLTVALVWLTWSSLVLAQIGESKQSAAVESTAALPAGTEVVLKSSATPLFDVGHWVPSADQLSFLVERVQDDKVKVVSRDKTIQGWLRREQVVPLDAAIDYFGQVLAWDRRNTDAYWMRARLWLYHGDADRAMANLEQAIRREPDQARFYLTRSLVHLTKERFDQAIADCDRAIQLDPQAIKAYVIRASATLARGDSARCRADLDQALRRDSINPIGRTVRASYGPAQEDGDPGKARLDRGETTTREPKNAADLVARGRAHLVKEEFDDAIADFTDAVRLDPAHAPAYVARAEAWARKHYRDRELADITTAVKLDPRNTAYRVARGQSCSVQGRHEEAMADFNAALGMEPENPALWVARGNEWRRDLKLDEALADYTRAIQLKPDFTLAYISRGQTWRQRRDFGRAIQEFAEVVRREPDNALTHMYLARILATCNDANSRNGKWAVDEATRACELTHWQDPDCLDTLAAACAENNDFPNAIKWQTRAIQRLRQKAPSILQRAMNFGGRRGVGFEERLAFYKSRKPTRE